MESKKTVKSTIKSTQLTLEDKILKQEEALGEKITYFNNNFVSRNYDKYGNEIKNPNTYLLSTYFFPTLNENMASNYPYSPSELQKIWKFYNKIVENINMYVTQFNPSLIHFSKYAGISLENLQNMKNSPNNEVRNIVNKIYDECYLINISLAQEGKVKERPTLERLKYENEVIEKKQPNVNVNVGINSENLVEINKRVGEIKKLIGRTNKLKEEQNGEVLGIE